MQRQGEPVKVTLPGEMYERSGRWWWKVQLPGENAVKARPLKASGAKAAASDCATAEKIAVEMWEQAIRREGSKQILLECTQKVEKLKAQFLDKVRHLTEIVQSATAKAQAEAQARAEIEAKLNAMTQAAALRTEDRGRRTATPLSGAETPAVNPQAAIPCPPAADAPRLQPQTNICECCGAADISTTDLEQIDSGQWLCTDCLAALHDDASRAESDAFAGSFA